MIDNHGTAVNVTVPKATARIKFRLQPRGPRADRGRGAGRRRARGIALRRRRGRPPELPADTIR